MRASHIHLFWLLVLGSGWLVAGWLNPAFAAEDKDQGTAKPAAAGEIQYEGRGEGYQPEPAKDECPATFGPIITDTAIPIEPGKFALQPTFGLSFTPRNFSPSWRRISAEGDFKSFRMSLKFTYGLWNNLEVYAVIPYIHNWAGNVQEPGARGERTSDFGGLGDINLTFKYRLVEETETAPTVSAIFSPTFPSGHFRRLNPGRLGTDAIGGGTYAFTSGFNVSKYLKPFILYGNLWYTMQTDNTTVGVDADDNPIHNRNHPRDYVTVNLAAEYPFTKKWVALVEMTSYWDGGRLIGHQANMAPTALLSILPGIEYMATDKFSLALGVQINLAGKHTTANITPLLSMAYAF